MKSTAWYDAKTRAGIIHVTIAAYNAFFKNGGVGLEILPHVIAMSTRILLVQEYGEYVEDFLEECTEGCVGKDGATKAKLVLAMTSYISKELPTGEKVDKAALLSSVDAVCSTKIPYGVSERLLRISTNKYVKLIVRD